MTSLRQTFGCPLPVSLVVVLMVGAMFTALAAPAIAGSTHLLTFTYQCDVFQSHESLDDVTTTMKINGGIWDGDELCQKFIPAGTIDLSGCKARRTAMRNALGPAADGTCLVTTDNGGGTGSQEDAPALQVLCRSSKKKKLMSVLFAACEQIHSFDSTIPAPPPDP